MAPSHLSIARSEGIVYLDIDIFLKKTQDVVVCRFMGDFVIYAVDSRKLAHISEINYNTQSYSIPSAPCIRFTFTPNT